MVEQPLTVPEAAFVTGHSVRVVNNEIDAGIVVPNGPAAREIGAADLIYLAAIRDLRTELAPAFRQRLRNTIAAAYAANRTTARVGHLSVGLNSVAAELADGLSRLNRLRAEGIEHRADILRGEPILRGTRIPARHIAEMIRQGASAEEIAHEFDLTRDQIEAAILFDRVSPEARRAPRIARRRVSAP